MKQFNNVSIKNILNKAQLKLFLRFTRYLLPYWKKEIVILVLSGVAVLLSVIDTLMLDPSDLTVDILFFNSILCFIK